MSYSFAYGSGTEVDPYQVWTAEDLDGVRDYLSAHFIQMADIGLGVSPWNSGDGWLPISTFTGTYDFNNFSINNLTINRPSTNNVGLFGKTGNGAVLLKPKLVNVSIIAYDYVGSLVGCVDDITQIINCSVSGDISGNDCIGGIVGCAYDVLMEQC